MLGIVAVPHSSARSTTPRRRRWTQAFRSLSQAGSLVVLRLSRWPRATTSMFDAVVGLAVDFRARSPLDHSTVDDDIVLHRPVRLVHGLLDTIVAPELAVTFAERHRPVCELTLVDADHAGVVGVRWNEAEGRCLPSSDVGPQTGLAAAVAAVEAVLRQ